MTPETQWIKTPLEDSLNWDVLPPETPGRVILKLWPPDRFKPDGLYIPPDDQRAAVGVAWVYRDLGSRILCPGDSVLATSYAIGSSLQFPQHKDIDLTDYRILDAENIYMVLPYAKAQAWRQKASPEVVGKIEEALPQIRLLAEEGDEQQSRAWLSKLMAHAERACGPEVMVRLEDEWKLVGKALKAHAERKVREAQEEEIAAGERLAAERKRIADERNK